MLKKGDKLLGVRFPYIFFFVALNTLSLVACQGFRIPQSPLLGTLERKSGRIAFVGMDGNIYTMNQAGHDVTSIT